MGIIELILTAIALSMDAFAVSVCKGLSTCKVKMKHMIVTGLWFGGFQALMPLIGYLLGSAFKDYITPVDHWVAFVLLAFLGINMVKEALTDGDECDCTDASFAVKVMFVMAIATSIDALAAGIALSMDEANIWIAISLIGAITFTLSAIGVRFGAVFGAKNKKYAELAGGIVLFLMGVKILLEHLGILVF